MSNYIDQTWEFPEGVLRLRLESTEPLRAPLILDLSNVIAVIEDFVNARQPDEPAAELS